MGADGKQQPDASPKPSSERSNDSPSQLPTHKPDDSGGSDFQGEGFQAILDKLAMMEKRQESVNAENKHQLQAVQAQYDSLGERLGAIEQRLQCMVATTDV